MNLDDKKKKKITLETTILHMHEFQFLCRVVQQ